MDDPLRETLDYIAITRLQSAYADVVNRRAWSGLHELFLRDAPVCVDTVTNPPIDIVGPGALGDFIGGAIERFEFFEFVILNARISTEVDDDPDAARGRLFMCELRQELTSGLWTNAFGVYHDDYLRVEGRWWFSRRRYQSLARTGASSRAEVFPFPQLDGFD